MSSPSDGRCSAFIGLTCNRSSPTRSAATPFDVAERLRVIKGAQRVGLRLREVRDLLEVLDRGLCPCGHAEALVRGRIAEIEGEIARLRELKRELESLLARYPAEACAADGGRWACETELIRAGEETRDGSS